MTSSPRILFDECVGWPIVEQLRILLGLTGTEICLGHVVKMGFAGQNDEDWLPTIASQRWIVVTADKGSKPKKGTGEKLPILCKRLGITHATLSASIHNSKSIYKVRAIMAVWDDLVSLGNSPRGSGYSIRRAGKGYACVCTYKPPESAQFDMDIPQKSQTTFPGEP